MSQPGSAEGRGLSMHDHGNCELCDQIERDLASAHQRIAGLEDERDNWRNDFQEACRQRDEAAAEIAAADRQESTDLITVLRLQKRIAELKAALERKTGHEAVCEVCWNIAWVPVPEEECAFVHPHTHGCARCDYCWLKDQYEKLKASLESAHTWNCDCDIAGVGGAPRTKIDGACLKLRAALPRAEENQPGQETRSR